MRPEVLRRRGRGTGMAGILYRCIFCDVSHEVAKRADGPVYLRCPTTYRWAWYDARAFEPAGGTAARPARGTRRGAAAAGAPRRRPASGGRRAAGATRAKAASRRTGHRASGRPASRKRSGKRGRR